MPANSTNPLPPVSEDLRALLLQAAGFAQAQQYDRAEATYMALLERAPNFAIARFQLGLLQFTGARPAVASLTWKPLDRLDDSHPLKLFKQGFEHLALDQFDAALGKLQEGIARNAENEPLNRDMAMVIERIRQVDRPKPSSEGEVAGAADDHFLVSTYRKLN